jgi:hypothetical protein
MKRAFMLWYLKHPSRLGASQPIDTPGLVYREAITSVGQNSFKHCAGCTFVSLPDTWLAQYKITIAQHQKVLVSLRENKRNYSHDQMYSQRKKKLSTSGFFPTHMIKRDNRKFLLLKCYKS